MEPSWGSSWDLHANLNGTFMGTSMKSSWEPPMKVPAKFHKGPMRVRRRSRDGSNQASMSVQPRFSGRFHCHGSFTVHEGSRENPQRSHEGSMKVPANVPMNVPSRFHEEFREGFMEPASNLPMGTLIWSPSLLSMAAVIGVVHAIRCMGTLW